MALIVQPALLQWPPTQVVALAEQPAAQQQTSEIVPVGPEDEITAAATQAMQAPGKPLRDLPLYLEVKTDRALLTVGATMEVRLAILVDGLVDAQDLTLTLDLPNSLATTNGAKGKLVWRLPTLPTGREVIQPVTLRIDKPKQALKRGVLTLWAELTATGYEKVKVSQQLGIAPETPSAEMAQSAEGAIAQSAAGDVVLLVAPGAVAQGVTFKYTPIHDWKRPGTVVTSTQSPVVSDPLVATTAEITLAQGLDAATTVNIDLRQTMALTNAAVSPTLVISATPIVTASAQLTSAITGNAPVLSPTAELTATALVAALYLPVASSGSAGSAVENLNDTAAETVVPVAENLLVEMPVVEPVVEMPLTLQSVPDEQPLQAAAAISETTPITPVSSGNIEAYAIWQLDATQNGSEVISFTQEVEVVVSAAELVAQGVNPEALGLWTRESESEMWVEVHSDYDSMTQLFRAWLPHFSFFSIGEALTSQGRLLPSMRAGGVDRFSGAATFNIAIETPAGLGGLTPNLSFSYSNVSVDDLFRNEGADSFKAQTSGVGIGWNLAGISYIARAGGTLDNCCPDQRGYVMALNGQFVRIAYENNVWRTDPEIFAKIERSADPGGHDLPQWIITTADGVKYTFGSPTVDATFSATRATSTYWQKSISPTPVYYQLANEWYLVKVQDPLGNQMEYSYIQEQGTESSCGGGGTWYTSAIYPSEIRWNQHSSGIGPHLKVAFTYLAGERADYKVNGWASGDCKHTKHAKFNRLQQVSMQALAQTVAGPTWQTIRSYSLNPNLTDAESYSTGVTTTDCTTTKNNNCKRLMLKSLAVKGQSGGTLQTYTFTYNGSANPNTIWLTTADNGFGGKITYSYGEQRPSCNNTICGHTTGKDKRQAVVTSEVEDGLGNKITTKYCYGNKCVQNDPATPAIDESTIDYQWGTIADSGEFMGYQRVETTYYAINSTSAVVKWEAAGTWVGGKADPDPRRGRLKLLEVRNLPSATSGSKVMAVTDNDWKAYRRHPSPDCTNDTNNNGWCATSITKQVFNSKWVTAWVRLEGTKEWADGAGKWTQMKYEYNRQNNNQFGNVTEVTERSHMTTTVPLGASDGSQINTWYYMMKNSKDIVLRKTVTEYFPNYEGLPNNTTALNSDGWYVVNQPARVRVFGVENNVEVCKAETRTVYDSLNENYDASPKKGLVSKIQRAISACSTGSPLAMYDSGWQETRMAYDGYGNQTNLHLVGSSATVGNQWYGTVYDTIYKLFPTQQTQTPSGFAENAVYYGVNDGNLNGGTGVWGQMKEHCGVNGLCTQQSYDEFGRPQRRWERVEDSTIALPSDVTANVLWGYSNPGVYGSSHKTFIVTEWRAPRCYGNFSRTLYNGLGQVVTIKTPYQDWSHNVDGCGVNDVGQEIDVNYTYDALGNQSKASVPRLVPRGTFATHGTDLSVATTTTYDALSRPVNITQPNGNQNYYTYAGRATAFWGKARSPDTYNKVLKRNDLDGLGRLQYIRTYTSSGAEDGVETLTHDVMGNLTKVTHAGNAGITTLEYDFLGRKTKMIDADLGTWTYAYDRQSNLTRQTDARGKTTCLYYEQKLFRLANKHFRSDTSCPAANYDAGGYPYLSGASFSVGYLYDEGHSSSNRSRGQLTFAFTYNGSKGWEKSLIYNNLGLLVREDVGIGTASWSIAFDYDSYQRPSIIKHHDGEIVTTFYNSMGLPNKLTSTINGTTTTLVDGDVASAGNNGATYDEMGRLVYMRFPQGGNLWRYNNYAAWTNNGSNGGMLTNISVGTTKGGNNRLRLDYNYDSFGNVKDRKESYNSNPLVTHYFTYDSQNRLTCGYATNSVVTNTCSQNSGQPYTYDNAGRLTSYEGKPYIADAAHPHAIAVVDGFTRYEYDQNGNVKTRNLAAANQQILTWDAENHLVSITGGGLPNETYLYDADGQRVWKVSNSWETFYVSPFYEESSSPLHGTLISKYYFFNGQRIAVRRDGIYYLHSDHLGSTALATDSTGVVGNPMYSQGYTSYGKYRLGGFLPTDHRFTGQKLDGSGLYYYNARYYDPQLGTFISPDTIVPDATNLFSWNRYMYVLGNPLRYSDPTGHDIWDTMQSVVDFAQGVGAQVGYNNTSMVIPGEYNGYAPQAGESTAMMVGRQVGNGVSIAQGVLEVVTGVGGMAGGAAACGTGALCAAGAPAVAGGYAVAAHGGAVALNAAANAGSMMPNLVMAVTGGSGNEQNIRSIEKSIRSLESQATTHERKLQDYIQNPDAFDNQGLLKNAPSSEIRQRIIQGRISHLNEEIQTFRNQINKLQQQLNELRNQ